MLPQIGPKTQELLHRLKIETPHDLLYHFPYRYIDFSHVKKISGLIENENATVSGTLVSFQNIFTRSHKNLQKARITDATGNLDLLWFNQPYLVKKFVIGQNYAFAGSVSIYQGRRCIIAPVSGDYHTGKIISIYPETKNLTSGWFRKTIQNNFSTLITGVSDPLPSSILKTFSLSPLPQSLKEVHLPTGLPALNSARLRLALEEILSLQVQSRLLKQEHYRQTPARFFTINNDIDAKLSRFIQNLPFKLTASQFEAWTDIRRDLLAQKPTNRLLVGDVGTGKTVLAMLAAILASENKTLTVFLAPTEILARQHYLTFKKYLGQYPLKLLTGTSKIPARLKSDTIIIATHAAIYQKKKFVDKIGLLIIDEQHRFGVSQRSFLSDLPHPPHILTMTATPIPRTISLTFLGHLDLSLLEFPPSFKLPIKTFLVPPSKRSDCYHWLHDQIKKTGQQAFIVCPFIDTSESMTTVKAATVEFEILKDFFPDLKLALVHGKIKPEAREKIFADFAAKKIDILITTPIIEVGIDFPNATTIIIQSADRFGLSQLHQLRGRVGRGSIQSYCYLFAETDNASSLDRLKFICAHTEGKLIAEYDLKTRGPGEVFSTLQHGFPSLKIADISDTKLINLSQKILDTILEKEPNFDLKKLIITDPAGNTNLTN